MPRPTPSRRKLALIVTPLIVLVVAANVGDALVPRLIPDHPLVLIALNARNRDLALATNYLDPLSYYLVGTVRLLVSDPLFFLLGYYYGDAAVRWMERRSPTFGGLMRSTEQLFGKASYPLVFIAPNNFICLFAGAAGMPIPVFAVLNVTGTIVRLYAIRWLGDVFSAPITDVVDFIQRYRNLLLAASIALVAFTVWRESRGSGESEITALRHLDDELASDQEHPEHEDTEAE